MQSYRLKIPDSACIWTKEKTDWILWRRLSIFLFAVDATRVLGSSNAGFTTPYFSRDQSRLLRAAWARFPLVSTSVNSVALRDSLLLANGHHPSSNELGQHGLGPLMDRCLIKLLS